MVYGHTLYGQIKYEFSSLQYGNGPVVIWLYGRTLWLQRTALFHPQTDSLSKRKNQWVEQYLQIV